MISSAGGADEPVVPARSERAGSAPIGEWVAVLEFASVDPCRPFVAADVEALIEHLYGWDPSGLWHADRYLIQLQIPARGPAEALAVAMDHHLEAAEAVGLPPTSTVRVEVLTVDSLEHSWREAEPTTTHAAPAVAGGPLCVEAYTATRSLLAAATFEEVARILTDFVVTVGGRVEAGAPRYLPGTVDIDLGLDGDQSSYASAEAFSVPGLIIEQSLPTLLTDAHRALARIQEHHHGCNASHPPQVA